MDTTLFFSIILFFFIVYSVAAAIAGSETPIRSALLPMASGTALLLALHISSPLTGVDVPVSLPSLLICAVTGVFGAVGLLLMNIFFI